LTNSSAARRLTIAVLAVLFVAPAAVLFFSAAGRSLQPTAHEPVRTLDAIVAWFGPLPDLALLTVLVVLPFAGLVLAGGFVVRTWTADEGARADTLALALAAARFGRRIPFFLAVLVFLFGVLYFAALGVHELAG
jgi:hypothetical protein